MIKVQDWDLNEDKPIVYKSCSETFADSAWNRYSLSAVPTARKPVANSVGYCRECDAICDIKVHDPHNSIKYLEFYFNDMYIESEKTESGWDIEKWFTADRPLLVVCMPYTTDYIKLEKNIDDAVIISWKQIRYNWETRSTLSKACTDEYLNIDYEKFALSYRGGLACVHKYNSDHRLNPNVKLETSIKDFFERSE